MDSSDSEDISKRLVLKKRKLIQSDEDDSDNDQKQTSFQPNILLSTQLKQTPSPQKNPLLSRENKLKDLVKKRLAQKENDNNLKNLFDDEDRGDGDGKRSLGFKRHVQSLLSKGENVKDGMGNLDGSGSDDSIKNLKITPTKNPKTKKSSNNSSDSSKNEKIEKSPPQTPSSKSNLDNNDIISSSSASENDHQKKPTNKQQKKSKKKKPVFNEKQLLEIEKETQRLLRKQPKTIHVKKASFKVKDFMSQLGMKRADQYAAPATNDSDDDSDDKDYNPDPPFPEDQQQTTQNRVNDTENPPAVAITPTTNDQFEFEDSILSNNQDFISPLVNNDDDRMDIDKKEEEATPTTKIPAVLKRDIVVTVDRVVTSNQARKMLAMNNPKNPRFSSSSNKINNNDDEVSNLSGYTEDDIEIIQIDDSSLLAITKKLTKTEMLQNLMKLAEEQAKKERVRKNGIIEARRLEVEVIAAEKKRVKDEKEAALEIKRREREVVREREREGRRIEKEKERALKVGKSESLMMVDGFGGGGSGDYGGVKFDYSGDDDDDVDFDTFAGNSQVDFSVLENHRSLDNPNSVNICISTTQSQSNFIKKTKDPETITDAINYFSSPFDELDSLIMPTTPPTTTTTLENRVFLPDIDLDYELNNLQTPFTNNSNEDERNIADEDLGEDVLSDGDDENDPEIQPSPPPPNPKITVVKGRMLYDTEDEEESSEDEEVKAFNALPEILRPQQPVKKSIFVEGEADEEDDEFRGLGGEDGEAAHEVLDDDDKMMVAGDGEEDVRKGIKDVKALHQRQIEDQDRKDIDALLNDVTSGALRKKGFGVGTRAMLNGGGKGFDLEGSDDDEAMLKKLRSRYAKYNHTADQDDNETMLEKYANNPETAAFAQSLTVEFDDMENYLSCGSDIEMAAPQTADDGSRMAIVGEEVEGKNDLKFNKPIHIPGQRRNSRRSDLEEIDIGCSYFKVMSGKVDKTTAVLKKKRNIVLVQSTKSSFKKKPKNLETLIKF